MPPVVITFAGFAFMLALLVFVHRVARIVSRRRVVAIAAGAVAGYLICALLFVVAIIGLGQQEQTLRVTVAPSGPAYEAGLRDGDRIVAVNGTSLATWEDLRAMIRASQGAPIDVQVERGGQPLRFDVLPRDGQAGVVSIVERHALPPGLVVRTAMASPVLAVVIRARELTTPRTMMGPVAIIEGEPSPWPIFFRLGELGSYAWPLSILIALVMSRSR